MIARLFRLLETRRHREIAPVRRRSSTHLTPKYEAERSRHLQRCLAQFKAGKVGEHFEPLKPVIVEDRVSGEMG